MECGPSMTQKRFGMEHEPQIGIWHIRLLPQPDVEIQRGGPWTGTRTTGRHSQRGRVLLD